MIDKSQFSPYGCYGRMVTVLVHSALNYLALCELCVRDKRLTGRELLGFPSADIKCMPTLMQVKLNVTKFLITFGSRSYH